MKRSLTVSILAATVVITSSHCRPDITVHLLAEDRERAERVDDDVGHANLLTFRDAQRATHSIRTAEQWNQRRRQIVANLQRVMGPFPAPKPRVAIDVKIIDEVRVGEMIRKKVTFQSDAGDRVPAYVMFPSPKYSGSRPAMLCLHQTTRVGKDEPLGIRGDANLKYALELVERGYVVIAPDYPSFGEHVYDFKAHPEYASGAMKAIWDNVRAVDVLETFPEVDRERIGVIGHSLGGHNAMFTAVFELRLKVIVSSCGFTTFRKDDLPSWTGPSYMPRIATEFENSAKRVPFDFEEIVASFAPRPFLACAAERDDDFDVSGVRDVMNSAAVIYRLYGAEKHLLAYYPQAPHSFPIDARQKSYEFLDRFLKPQLE